MSRHEVETILSMAAAAAACALPGVLLVLRRLVLVADAISHVLLLGIVLAYLIVRDASSIWLLVGAAASGLLTVALVEALQRARHIREDAAIGLVFPALFSIGVILASMNLRNVHLDVDRVLFGSAELIPLDRITRLGFDLPRALVTLGTLFVLQSALLVALYKEVKLSVFDAGLAAAFGFMPVVLHYGLMACVSLTTVAAFDAVGPVLVLAFFAVPPAAARLLTDRMGMLFLLSCMIAIVAAAAGTWLAFQLETTIAGTAATLLGIIFAAVLCVAPERGLIWQAWRRVRQRRSLHLTMLLIHLQTHEGTANEEHEAGVEELPQHLAWTDSNVHALAARAEALGLIERHESIWKLTPEGRKRAIDALIRPTLK